MRIIRIIGIMLIVMNAMRVSQKTKIMKRQEFQQLKEKAQIELKKDLKNFQEKLRGLKFNLAAGKVKNIKEIKSVKKIVARILTLINLKKK